MAERKDADREVLTSLPRSRPVRRSAKRGDRTDATNGAPAESKTPPPRASAAKAQRAKTTGGGAAKTTSARAGKATAARATRPAAGRAARSTSARTTAEQPRSGPARKVPPAGYAAPRSSREDAPASGTAELVSTTIQAAAELAQIGLTVGRQTLQSMFERLPKP